jgi:hypothetical protein
MSTVFPPTSIEIGVSKLQGTIENRTMKINMGLGSALAGGGKRTGVDAFADLGCQPCAADRAEKVRDARGVTENQGRSSVEGRRRISYHRVSVHGYAVEGRLPETLSQTRAYLISIGKRMGGGKQTSSVKGSQVKSPV